MTLPPVLSFLSFAPACVISWGVVLLGSRTLVSGGGTLLGISVLACLPDVNVIRHLAAELDRLG